MDLPEKRLNEWSATEAAAAIAAGRLTSTALVAACLERIAAREADVQAWACLDPDQALAAARACDREPPRSRLHGLPVGIKDVIDTADLPTEYGSPIYRGNRPSADAACVAQIREKGGIVLGKTVSTEFATRHPNKTRNPRDPSRTPGGSSSGSGAAVADCMVPLALGTQTTSSVIRPAAYCGIVGYKPTFGLLNRAGLKFLSESLDTLGVLSRTVPDAAMLVEELSGMPSTSFDGIGALRPRIGLCRTPFWHLADAATHEMLESAAAALSRAGARVSTVELDNEFGRANDVQTTISTYEFHRALAYERTRFPEQISESLTARLAAGGKVTYDDYRAALDAARRFRARIAEVCRDCDVLIAPSTTGEAPDLATTGDPVFGVLWTLLRLPCLTLPHGAGPSGLPLGVQVIAAAGCDGALFRHAEWVRRALNDPG